MANLAVEVLYDGFPDDAVAAFCAEPLAGITFTPGKYYRRAAPEVGLLPVLIMLFKGSAAVVVLKGFLDELGRPLAKAIGNDIARVYQKLRDRLRILVAARSSRATQFVLLIEPDAGPHVQCVITFVQESDLDAMFDALPEVIGILERTLEEYRGQQLSNIFLRFDPGERAWLRDQVWVDDVIIPGDHLRAKPTDTTETHP